MNIVLEGIVGSHCHGLATDDSDVDLLGIFLAPGELFLGLKSYQETVHSTSDETDKTYHELGKFCSLALAANPTILEVLFLDSYTVSTDIAKELLELRKLFLSRRCVKTYGGYALQQFSKIQRDERASAWNKDTQSLSARKKKHCRHMFRLLWQGTDLLSKGHLEVALSEERKKLLAELTQQLDINAGFNTIRDLFYKDLNVLHAADKISSLAKEPDIHTINSWLINTRLNSFAN